jgi:hypothetical protein
MSGARDNAPHRCPRRQANRPCIRYAVGLDIGPAKGEVPACHSALPGVAVPAASHLQPPLQARETTARVSPTNL